MSVQTLIELVNAFNARTDVPVRGGHGYLTDTNWLESQTPEFQKAVDQIRNAAQDLITSQGYIPLQVLDELAGAGIVVRRGEWDSFGWLTGIVETKHGIIVFG